MNRDPNKTLIELFDEMESAQQDAERASSAANSASTAHSNAELKVEKVANEIYDTLVKMRDHSRQRYSKGFFDSKLGKMLYNEKERNDPKNKVVSVEEIAQ